MNYLQTIFTSYYKDPNCLTDLLTQAKRDNNILDTAFYSECTSVVAFLKESFNTKLCFDLEKINRGFLIKNLTPVQEASLDEQLKKCTLENITVQLLSVTNGLFTGKLNYSEVEFIEMAINKLQAPKPQDDVTYVINIFENSEVESISNYRAFKYQIESNGCFIFNNAKIYTPQLTYFLSLVTLNAYNKNKKTYCEISGRDYLKTYTTAYLAGRQFFENEFKPSISILYGINAESYIQNISDNYYKIHHYGPFDGWSFVKNTYPATINHEVIKQYGYYAGIVSKVNELAESHQKIFEKFAVHEDENEKTLREYKIREYKSSFNCGLFNNRIDLEVQKKITTAFNDWYNQADKSFSENTSFGKHKDLICTYNKSVLFLGQKTVALYKAINGYLDTENRGHLTSLTLCTDDVLRSLETIKSYSIKIKKQSVKGADTGLIEIREYCISQLDEVIHLLKDTYTIDLQKSPLKKELKKAQRNLKNSISTDLIQKFDNPKPIRKLKKDKTFYDFIHNVDNPELFAKELKSTFKNESGINFKILIELLKEEKIFLVSNFAEFFRIISPYFGDTIGSQRGLNDLYKHTTEDKKIHKAKIEVIIEKLNPLITKHKIKN